MQIVYINKENFVGNLFIKDAHIPLLITEEQYEQVRCFDNYTAWKYFPETNTFKLENIITPEILRKRRQQECFKIIDNKSFLWWQHLSETQKIEIENWYISWLKVTETFMPPNKPSWLEE